MGYDKEHIDPSFRPTRYYCCINYFIINYNYAIKNVPIVCLQTFNFSSEIFLICSLN